MKHEEIKNNEINIHNIKKVYQDGFQALKGISLSIKQGSFYGLLGPNGAGKSTLIGILCGLVNKSDGHISILGFDHDKEAQQCRQLIGIVPQEFNFNIFESCLQIVCNHAGYYGVPYKKAKPLAEKLMKKLGIYDKRHRPAGQLSGGQKRRLMIVRALVHQPKVLILDEPTAGVDIALRHTMWHFLSELNQEGLTIILTTHYLEEAEKLCDQLAIIHQGQVLAEGKTQNLLDNLKNERFLLKCHPFNQQELSGNQERIQIKDEEHLLITIKQEEDIFPILEDLNKQGVKVRRVINQANRLEEVFLNLVTENE